MEFPGIRIINTNVLFNCLMNDTGNGMMRVKVNEMLFPSHKAESITLLLACLESAYSCSEWTLP